MQDRVPLYPGRVRLTPVSGQANTYDMVRADEPTQEGDPLSKATFLKDDTAALFGLGSDAVPDDVFMKLAVPASYYGFDITVKFSDGTPIPGVLLNGLQSLSLGDAFTDENGKCFALASTKTVTITISDYIGVPDTETSVSAEDGVAFTQVNITLERDTSLHLIRESKVLKVLTGVPVDMCIVGGGASGIAPATNDTEGYGGGGGFVKNILGVVLSNSEVVLSVGAGGEGSKTTTTSQPGGDTSVTYNGITSTAQGSPGLVGNGSYGGDGATHVFNDDSLPLPGGGGGSGTVTATTTRKPGGKDFGGDGGYYSGSANYYAMPGSGPGGGGGGSQRTQRNGAAAAGSGAAGGLYIRVNDPGVSA